MSHEINQIEMTIEQADAKIEKAKKVHDLLATPLFKELVTDEYLGNDAVRLTLMLGRNPEGDDRVQNMLKAKAIFSRFFSNILIESEEAANAKAQHEALLRGIESGEIQADED